MTTLDAALAGWDRSRAASAVAEADALRRQVVERFSLEAWPEMPLEEMPEARFASDYEEAAWFVPRAELNSLPIEPNQLVFAWAIANAPKDRSNWLAPR